MTRNGYQTTTIECSCATCKINSEKVGAAFPLRAEITVAMANTVKTRKGRHNLIETAHHPALKAPAFGPWPVR